MQRNDRNPPLDLAQDRPVLPLAKGAREIYHFPVILNRNAVKVKNLRFFSRFAPSE